MSDLRSSNLFDLLDDDGQATSVASQKKEAKADKQGAKKAEVPKKEKVVAKQQTEEPAAPLGKDLRGVVPSHKSRGRGRDNKGGLRGPPRGGREFDRRSGPSGSHRQNPREGKRGEHGKHNWGNQTEESTIAAQTEKAEEATSPNPVAATEEAKADAATPAENKDAEQKEVAKLEDPEDEADKKLVTYEQYLKNKKSLADDTHRARAVQVDEKRFSGTPIESAKKKKTKEEDKDDEADKQEKTPKKKKEVLSLDEFRGSPPTAPAPRPRPDGGERRGGSNGRGRGGRGAGRGSAPGRGGPSRGRGGRGRGRGGAGPDLDETAFPKLGK